MDLLERLYDLLPAAATMGPLMVVGIVLASGFLGGLAARAINLPSVTGNLLAGVLIGPSAIGLLSDASLIDHGRPLSAYAMGLIAVRVGGHLSYRRIHNALRRIVAISLAEVIGAVVLVSLAARALGFEWPWAVLLGTIAAATAPATTVALIRETRSKGPFVKTLLSVVAVDNILCIALFAFAHRYVEDYYRLDGAGVEASTALLVAAWQLGGCVILGVAAGIAIERLVPLQRTHTFSTVFLTVLMATGVSTYLGLSPLMTDLFLGIYLCNRSHRTEEQLDALAPVERVLYVGFFTLAGVSLHLDALGHVGVMCLGYLAARAVGKSLGAAAGGILGRGSQRIWGYLPFALVPQAGVAIALVVLLSTNEALPAEIRNDIAALVLAAVTVNEIIGPLLTRWSLQRAGEAGKDRPRLIEFLQEEFILTDMEARDRWSAITELADFHVRTHRTEHIDRERLIESIVNRENQMCTAVGKGVAIPHGYVDEGPAIQGVLGISRHGVDFDAPDDRPVHMFLLVVTPKDQTDQHLQVMASLAAMAQDDVVRTRLMAAIDANDAWEIIESKETPDYNDFLDEEE